MNVPRPPEFMAIGAAFILASLVGAVLALPLLMWLTSLGSNALAGTTYAAAFLGLGWLGAYAVKRNWYRDTP
jgi:hypothetical protein